MNIVIKKYQAQKKISSVIGGRTHENLIQSPTPWPLGHIRSEVLGFQIKQKYKKTSWPRSKRYAVRVLLM